MWLRNLKQKWSSYLTSNSLTVAHAAIDHCHGVIEARLVLPFHHKKYWCTCQIAVCPVILWQISVGTFQRCSKSVQLSNTAI